MGHITQFEKHCLNVHVASLLQGVSENWRHFTGKLTWKKEPSRSPCAKEKEIDTFGYFWGNVNWYNVFEAVC